MFVCARCRSKHSLRVISEYKPVFFVSSWPTMLVFTQMLLKARSRREPASLEREAFRRAAVVTGAGIDGSPLSAEDIGVGRRDAAGHRAHRAGADRPLVDPRDRED